MATLRHFKRLPARVNRNRLRVSGNSLQQANHFSAGDQAFVLPLPFLAGRSVEPLMAPDGVVYLDLARQNA